MNEPIAALSTVDERRRLSGLVALGLVSWALYVAIAVMSARFSLDVPSLERPHLLAFGLFAVLFALYLVAVRLSVRMTSRKPVLLIIGLFAVAFRLVLLPTPPIQEIDLYRYVWDGQVAVSLVSPYRFSPQEVIVAAEGDVTVNAGSLADPQLWMLVGQQKESVALGQIVRTVHYGELTTPYPPVSQFVFAVSAALTPRDASVETHLVVMKGLMVLFDLGTLVAVIGILIRTGKPVGWCAAYAWCPLVLKEFANSGHLDAIAVFFTTVAVWLLLSARGRTVWPMAMLGLAVGAKIYPIVLAPLCVALIVRREGWLRATTAAGVLLAVSTVVLGPMVSAPRAAVRMEQSIPVSDIGGLPPLPTDLDANAPATPPLPVETAIPPESATPPSGLRVFLTQWKMNDFLFLIVSENLNPANEFPSDQRPWFVVVPFGVRRQVSEAVASMCSVDAETGAFLLARGLTLCVFGLMVLTWTTRLLWAEKSTRSHEDAGPVNEQFLEAAFLTLAWFWLLSPTQNPWYWTWALPLIPFARSRVWLWVAGVVMTYYLRFWCVATWPEAPGPLGSEYSGASFFDYVVSWAEFGPLLACLTIDACLGRFRRR